MLIQAPEGKPSMTERATAKGVTEVQVYRLGGNGFGQMATPHNIEF